MSAPRSKHDPLSVASILAFQEVADLIPDDIPLILETPVPEGRIGLEMDRVREALPMREEMRGWRPHAVVLRGPQGCDGSGWPRRGRSCWVPWLCGGRRNDARGTFRRRIPRPGRRRRGPGSWARPEVLPSGMGLSRRCADMDVLVLRVNHFWYWMSSTVSEPIERRRP